MNKFAAKEVAANPVGRPVYLESGGRPTGKFLAKLHLRWKRLKLAIRHKLKGEDFV